MSPFPSCSKTNDDMKAYRILFAAALLLAPLSAKAQAYYTGTYSYANLSALGGAYRCSA